MGEKLLGRFKSLRTDLRHNYKIKKSDQIHAYELLGGRGIWKSRRYSHLTSAKRKLLFKYILSNYATWPEMRLISVSVDKLCGLPSITSETAREKAYENLFNRIDKTLNTERSNRGDEGLEEYIVINDGQEDTRIIRLLRKLRAYNQINTSYAGRIDIKIKSLIEDPLFKYARDSYFLQAIDHIAFATLHIFDSRLDMSIGKDLLKAGIYKNLGIAAVHSYTATHFPGVVLVPSRTVADVRSLHASLNE